MTRKEFAAKVNALISSDTKILRSVTIAQAILESSDSKGNVANSNLTLKGNALFGIKASVGWKGKRMDSKTFEVYSGTTVNIVDSFRAYDNWGQSVADHHNFLVKENSTRYSKVIGEKDYKVACNELKAAGYATAPNYAQVLISLIETHELYKFDAPTDKWQVRVFAFSDKNDAKAAKEKIDKLGYYNEVEVMKQ